MFQDRKNECKIKKHHTGENSGSFSSYYFSQAHCVVNLWGLTITSTYYCHWLLFEIESSGYIVLEVRALRWNRLTPLPDLFFPPGQFSLCETPEKCLHLLSSESPNFLLNGLLFRFLKQPLTLGSQSISCDNIVKTASSYAGKISKMLEVSVISKFSLPQPTFFPSLGSSNYS